MRNNNAFGFVLLCAFTLTVLSVPVTKVQKDRLGFSSNLLGVFVTSNQTVSLASLDSGLVGDSVEVQISAPAGKTFVVLYQDKALWGIDSTVYVTSNPPTQDSLSQFQLPITPECAVSLDHFGYLAIVGEDGSLILVNLADMSNPTSNLLTNISIVQPFFCSYLRTSNSLYIFQPNTQNLTTVVFNPVDPSSTPLVASFPISCTGVNAIYPVPTRDGTNLLVVHETQMGPYNMHAVAQVPLLPHASCTDMIGIGPGDGDFQASASDGSNNGNIAIMCADALYIVDLGINDIMHLPVKPLAPNQNHALVYSS